MLNSPPFSWIFADSLIPGKPGREHFREKEYRRSPRQALIVLSRKLPIICRIKRTYPTGEMPAVSQTPSPPSLGVCRKWTQTSPLSTIPLVQRYDPAH